ncbi:hypothetical protein NHJ13051_002191 [Beauveria bassiana]
MSRVPSRASSTCARHAVIIPRSERRGLPSRFTILPEIENPYDSKRATKWGITATITVAAAAAPLGSSIFLPRASMGAVGARAMHRLQNYGEDEPVYDGNARTFSSPYHAGTGRGRATGMPYDSN